MTPARSAPPLSPRAALADVPRATADALPVGDERIAAAEGRCPAATTGLSGRADGGDAQTRCWRSARRFPLALGGIALAIVGWIQWFDRPRPTGPAEGTSLCGPSVPARGGSASNAAQPSAADKPTPPARRHIRVASYNIHGGKGTDGRRDLSRIAADLEGCDFVALNEVYSACWNVGDDQATSLGRMLGQGSLFAPAARLWFTYESGNGLLSALPIRSWQRVPLAKSQERSFRNYVLVDVAGLARPLHVLLTHINRSHEVDRQSQLKTVIAQFRALPAPCLLIGDLNSTPDDPQLVDLLADGSVSDALARATMTARERAARIDWILARGLNVAAAGQHASGASDHPVIWAELTLPEETPT